MGPGDIQGPSLKIGSYMFITLRKTCSDIPIIKWPGIVIAIFFQGGAQFLNFCVDIQSLPLPHILGASHFIGGLHLLLGDVFFSLVHLLEKNVFGGGLHEVL